MILLPPKIPLLIDFRINSLAPGGCAGNVKLVMFISKIDIMNISCETALRYMPQKFTDDQSTLVQVMAWCLTAPSQNLKNY